MNHKYIKLNKEYLDVYRDYDNPIVSIWSDEEVKYTKETYGIEIKYEKYEGDQND